MYLEYSAKKYSYFQFLDYEFVVFSLDSLVFAKHHCRVFKMFVSIPVRFGAGGAGKWRSLPGLWVDWEHELS